MIPLARKGKLASNRDNRIKSMIMTRRQRKFLLHWSKEFAWLLYVQKEDKMCRSSCKQYDKTGSSVTGSSSFKLDPIRVHDGSLVMMCLVRDIKNRKYTSA